MRERRSKSGDATTTKRGRTAHCSDPRRSSTQTAAEDWHNRWTETGGRSTAWPVFRRYSHAMALWFLALAVATFSLTAVENINLLSMLSLLRVHWPHSAW